MDRHRGGGGGDRSYGGSNNGDSRRPSRFSDGPPSSRFSDGPPPRNRYSDNGTGGYGRRSPNNYRGRDGGRHAFDSPPRHGPPGSEGFRPIGGDDGGGFWPIGGGGAGFSPNYHGPPMPLPPPSLSGQKRSFSGRGSSPDRLDNSNFAKLFVGSVPRTATEENIRPLFEEHGNVMEVALLKDKRTGQQQGCCFIKYATSEEADRAIKGLHNQRTLPGGVGPIQVRYADGERERLGAVEHKLFVGSLNKQASVKEVEEIFLPYGQVEDVYLMRDEMKQSRGCGFVKYAHRDMALAAINALNGIYRMRGCDQPLIVRFADPKKPRPGAGDARGPPSLNPTFGGPGFGPQFQGPGPRPGPNFGEPFDDRVRPNAWNPMSAQCAGASPGGGPRGFGSHFPPRSADPTMPFNQGGNGTSDRVLPGSSVPSAAQQGFNPPLAKLPSINQQMSPAQRSLQSPQQLPTGHGQVPSSYSHTHPSHAGQPPLSQALPARPAIGLSGQVPTSQPQFQQGTQSTTAPRPPLNMNFQSHSGYPGTNQQPFPAPAQQQIPQSLQQSPSQLAQMLSQQTQTLQATYNSSQQVFSQLQQQVQMMQPSNQNVGVQPGPKGSRQQVPPSDIPPSTSAPTTVATNPNLAPMKCIWTEHTSPEGFKYYYNSTTGESKWEKPNELLFEQQQTQESNQQKHPVQQQPLNPSNPQGLAIQQTPQSYQQLNPAHLQAQFQHQQLQQPSLSAMEPGYAQFPQAAGTGNGPARFQGLPAAQELMWKNKPTGN